MGNLFSSESAPKDIEDTMNFLLRGIFTNIDLMDMYAMMDENKCKEYVIFGEKALSDIFVKMDLYPQRDSRGMIYFRKMSTLRGRIGDSPEHKKMCREIAWFFATFLRCFAAILMTVMKAQKSLDTVAGTALRPTEELFQQKSWAQRAVNKVKSWRDQKGGAIQNILGITINSNNHMSLDMILTRIIKSHFSFDGANINELELDNNERNTMSEVKITVDTDKIFYQEFVQAGLSPGRGSPLLFSPSPTPLSPQPRGSFLQIQPETVNAGPPDEGTDKTLYSLLQSISSGTSEQPLPSMIGFVYRGPIPLTYTFGKGGEYSITFEMEFKATADGNPNSRYSIHLMKFNWGIPPSSTREGVLGRINIETAVQSNKIKNNAVYIPVGSGGDLNFSSYLLGICKQAENEAYINPNVTTSDFLVKWKYLRSDISSGRVRLQNIAPEDLYFDETTRKSQTVKITYLKPNVKIPNRPAETLYIDCYITIVRKEKGELEDRYQYTVTMQNINAKARSQVNLEGVFVPFENTRYSIFGAMSEMETPVNRSGNTIPQWIRGVADKCINTSITSGDTAYAQIRTGDMLRIPIQSQSQYDLGKLQQIMLPKSSPFPACTALAAELMRKIGTNPITEVCNPKFRARQDGSLPKSSGDLTSSKGILALSSLFLNTMDQDASRISEMPEWKEFVEQIGKVNTWTPKERCKEKGTSMELDRSFAAQLQGVVDSLIERQRQHNLIAFQLLWKLVDENSATREKRFRINERLYSGGMEELLRVQQEIRSELMRYYIECDETYLQGLNMILDNQGKPVTSVDTIVRGSNENDDENDNDEENVQERIANNVRKTYPP